LAGDAPLNAADFPPFRARAPWWGGDLQTLRNSLSRAWTDLGAYPGERLFLPMRDGSGDTLVAQHHRPGCRSGDRPLAVLIHGLTGCEDSTYVRASARHLLELGYPVLRINLRGAGPSRPLCRQQYHAGRTSDLADALTALEVPSQGLVLIGYSLGANMLLKFLAEHGARFPVRAAVAVSAPIDLAAAQRRLMAPRNRPYHAYLVARMKAEAAQRPGGVTPELEAALASVRTVYDFDEYIVAPANGFRGADHYYEENGARRFLRVIAVPTLVIHARDDPWIPVSAYDAVDWSGCDTIVCLLAAGGGHVGFHGAGAAWHDQCAALWFERMT
jgi:predicted alpha/beta-fold hydrolase